LNLNNHHVNGWYMRAVLKWRGILWSPLLVT
jgi:hypothetical protein